MYADVHKLRPTLFIIVCSTNCIVKGSEDVNLSPEEGNLATKMLAAVKDSMKEICLHEMIASNSDKSVQQPQMCAKVAVDKVSKLITFTRMMNVYVCT